MFQNCLLRREKKKHHRDKKQQSMADRDGRGKIPQKKYGLKKAFMVSAGRKKDEGKREAYYQELGRV